MMVIRLPHMPGEEPAPRQNKFRARRTPCNQGHTHASAAEAGRCNDLTLLQRGGHIRNLEQQPKFTFTDSDGRQIKQLSGQPMRYTADFRYDEAGNDGEWHDVVEDFKSLATMTEAATLRLALFKHYHPGKLKIVGRGIAARGTGGRRKGAGR